MAEMKKSKMAGNSSGVSKTKPARTMLMMAVLLSVVSIAGGFFLARSAFEEDAKKFDPALQEEDAGIDNHAPEDGNEANTERASVDDLSYPEKPMGNHDEEAKNPPREEESTEGFLVFKDFTTNIGSLDQSGVLSKRFLKLSVVLIYNPQPGVKNHLINRQPFMRDLFNVYIRSLIENDLRGAAGVLALKSELLKRARAAAGNNMPTEILISDLIVN